jgi:Uma2 family endonuclease
MTVVERDAATRERTMLPLENGDHLTRAEFERRYEAMPHVKKAELIEGAVHMPSPVSASHGRPHVDLSAWVAVYAASTPGLDYASDVTVRLDGANEFQPDVHLRIRQEHGGQSRMSPEGYVEGAPELVVEVSASTASIDLHTKLRAYERNGVREYVVCRARDDALDWFVLRDGEFRLLAPNAAGIFTSEVFPGLRLDPEAVLKGRLARVLAIVQEGIASEEHARFVADLAARGPR